MIRCVFFDVGGVLLNDDPVMALVFRHIWQSIQKKGHRLTFEELLRLREEISAQGAQLRIHHEVALRFLSLEEWKATRRRYLDQSLPRLSEYCPLMPGMKTLVRKMHKRVQLGIVANQPDDIIPVLQGHGLWEPFAIKGISEVVGLSKPDPDFYRWALRQAGYQAGQCVMIGDTLKYDIRPAKSVGMKTIWFNPGHREKRLKPRDEFERAYFESLKRQRESRHKRILRDGRPDAIAANCRQLGEVLHEMLKDR